MPKSLGLATKVVGAGTRLRARAGRGPRRESALKASVLFGGEGRTFGISGNPLMGGYKKRVAATPAPNWSGARCRPCCEVARKSSGPSMQPDVNAVDTVRFRSRLLSSLPATGLRASPGRGSRALAGLPPPTLCPAKAPGLSPPKAAELSSVERPPRPPPAKAPKLLPGKALERFAGKGALRLGRQASLQL